MKRYIDELSKRIDELLKIYEQFLWKDKNRKLAAIFYNDYTIAFNLYEGTDQVDELYLSFEEKEGHLYRAACLQTFKIMLGNVMVYKGQNVNENIYYNEKIKPYFLVVSTNDEVTELLDSLVLNQEENVIDNNNKIIKNVNYKVKQYSPNIPVLNEFDNRIELSKELLRRY